MTQPSLVTGPLARPTLRQLAWLFLRLGATSFGGPAAHVALMEREVVRQRGWLSHPEFLDLLAATYLIPGPNSTELAIHLGYRQAGLPGLVVAGASFILPAAVLVTLCAWAYVAHGTLPAVGGVLRGVQPVIVAIVAQALWHLGRSVVKTWRLAGLAIACLVANLAGVPELTLLALAAALVVAARRSGGLLAITPLVPLLVAFLRIGSVLFGSGYVLLAFLRADLVQHRHWLTEAQLLDATAVGQFTPGPVFTTATFIGYLLAGLPGALVATVGIFLPAFVFVGLSVPLLPRMQRSPTFRALLDGLNVGSLALMAAVTLELARAALVRPWQMAVFVLSGAVLLRWRVQSAWLVLAGGVVGWTLA